MSNISIQPRNFVLKTNSSFRFDFDVVYGEERIQSITAGGAIDDYNYLFAFSPNGETREFTFDFLPLRKGISSTSILNMVIRIMDIDGGLFEFSFSKNYATENGLPSISNPRISQRSDGTKLVDIEYDYESPSEIDPAYVYVQISSDFGKTWVVPTTTSTGDIGYGIAAGTNKKITWSSGIGISIVEPTPITARIYVINSNNTQAIGNNLTGTLMLLPAETITPILSIVPSGEKLRFGKKNGNLYKNNSIDFVPILGSSSSSDDESELSETSETSETSDTPKSELSEISDVSSDPCSAAYLAVGFDPVFGINPNGTYVKVGKRFINYASGAATLEKSLSPPTVWKIVIAGGTIYQQSQIGGTCPDSYSWISIDTHYSSGTVTPI